MTEMTATEEARTAAEADARAEDGKRKKRIKLLGFVALLLLAAIAYGAYWLFVGRFHEVTDDAYVQGDTINVSTQVPGTVVAVNFALTQYVKRGEEIVRLDDTDARVALAQAEADLAQAVRKASELFRMADADDAKVSELRERLTQAKADLKRSRQLISIGGVSTEELQHLETSYRSANAALKQAQQQHAAARTAVSNTSVEQHPLVKQAEAHVRSAWTALARTRVLAPESGYVSQKQVAVGQHAAPGMPLLAIVPPQYAYVAANFKESQLGEIRLGQPVTLTSDLYGSNVTYHGRVVGFSLGTGAALSVLPPQNASGNWIKIVQRLPVRVAITPDEMEKHPLMLGLSMNADVDIHDGSGAVLSRKPVFNGATTTDVYAAQLSGADELIAQIVMDNVLPSSHESDDALADGKKTPKHASRRRTAMAS